MPELNLEAIAATWLKQCGPCDLGMPEYGCTHPEDDYRPVILGLVNEVKRLRGLAPPANSERREEFRVQWWVNEDDADPEWMVSGEYDSRDEAVARLAKSQHRPDGRIVKRVIFETPWALDGVEMGSD